MRPDPGKGRRCVPDILQAALDQSGVDTRHSITVGDTMWDVEAAARAGLSCVGVLTGGSRATSWRAGAAPVTTT